MASRFCYSDDMKSVVWTSAILLGLSGACSDDSPVPDPPSALDAGAQADSPVSSDYTLDPDSLLFYSLPIGSLRFAVSGYEPTLDMCVTLIWFIGETTNGDYQLCGPEPTPTSMSPYAVIAPVNPANPTPDGPQYGAQLCEVWDYGSNATVEDVTGCVEFSSTFPTTGSADLVVELDSPSLQGTVLIRSP